MQRKIDRLDKYIEYSRLNDNQVTKTAGLTIGVIGKSRKEGRDLSVRAIELILQAYPELNGEWLLTGEGEMLKKPAGPEAELEQMIAEQTYEALMRAYEKGEIYPGAVVKQMINEKDEKIEGLQKRLWELEHENETLKEELSAYKKK